MKPAVARYVAKTRAAPPVVSVDAKNFLPPPPSADASVASCSGGVVVTTADGRTVVSNTLDDRLAISFEANLPELRRRLFRS